MPLNGLRRARGKLTAQLRAGCIWLIHVLARRKAEVFRDGRDVVAELALQQSPAFALDVRMRDDMGKAEP